MVGARLQARHVPRLEFRLDAPSAEEAALDATFERLATERAAEDARRARAAAASAPAGGPDRA
jgi:1,4-alpha-glucan branching enzyme